MLYTFYILYIIVNIYHFMVLFLVIFGNCINGSNYYELIFLIRHENGQIITFVRIFPRKERVHIASLSTYFICGGKNRTKGMICNQTNA